MCDFFRDAAHFFTFYIVILVTFYAMTAFFRFLGTVTYDYNVAARLAAFLITLMVICELNSQYYKKALTLITSNFRLRLSHSCICGEFYNLFFQSGAGFKTPCR